MAGITKKIKVKNMPSAGRKKKAPSPKAGEGVKAKKPATPKKAPAAKKEARAGGARVPRARKSLRAAEEKKNVSDTEMKKRLVLEHLDQEAAEAEEPVNINFKGKPQREEAPAALAKKEDKSPAPEDEPAEIIDDKAIARRSGLVKDIVTTSIREEESRKTEKITETKANARRSIRLYRKIALIFIFLTVALLAAVFYFNFIRVEISLIPNQERISNNMIFDIYDSGEGEDPGKNAIGGVVRKTEVEYESAYGASGTEVIGEEAVGKVVIINNYTKNQPLVATTRLLTAEGKMFRIKNTVNAPAGGSVEVDIYADKPSADMAVGPTKFTIPGLWAGLQDQIYAESREGVVYQQKVKKHITQDDIDNSVRELKKELLTKAKSDINENYREYSQIIIYKIDENSIASEVLGKVGEEKDNFTVRMEADVLVVAFDDKSAANLAKQRFLSSLAENKELVSFDEKNIIYSLSDYNEEGGLATVSAAFEGKVSLKDNTDIVEVDKILGLQKDQLEAYLATLPEIAGFEVRFQPSFLPGFLQKVPRLVDKVKIEIKR